MGLKWGKILLNSHFDVDMENVWIAVDLSTLADPILQILNDICLEEDILQDCSKSLLFLVVFLSPAFEHEKLESRLCKPDHV